MQPGPQQRQVRCRAGHRAPDSVEDSRHRLAGTPVRVPRPATHRHRSGELPSTRIRLLNNAPVLVIMSQQIDPVLVTRYRASGWGLLRGLVDEPDSLISTFAFFEQVLGYDLIKFFERNHKNIRAEVDGILRSILEAT